MPGMNCSLPSFIGHPSHVRPVDSVGTAGDHERVGLAALGEAAVAPDRVDAPVGAHLRARERSAAQVARHGVVADMGHDHLVAPARAAVGRAEGDDRLLEGVGGGDDDVAVRLDDRLAAQAVHALRRHDRRAPCEPAIARRAHQDAVAVAEVVPLVVAVAVVRAGAGVVARDPVLVEVLRRSGVRHRDRPAPGEAAVRGAVDHDRGAQRAWVCQAERGDHPDVVLGVERDDRVGRAVEVGRPDWAQGRAAPRT